MFLIMWFACTLLLTMFSNLMYGSNSTQDVSPASETTVFDPDPNKMFFFLILSLIWSKRGHDGKLTTLSITK